MKIVVGAVEALSLLTCLESAAMVKEQNEEDEDKTAGTSIDKAGSKERISSISSLPLTLLNANLFRYGNRNKAVILLDCFWSENSLDGAGKACMIEKVRDYARNNVFPPHQILKAMDLAGFNVSLTGVELLLQLKTGETGSHKRGFLPSKSLILRCARKIEELAETHCPYSMIGRTFNENFHGQNDEEPSCEEDEEEESDDCSVGEGFEGIEFDVLKKTETLSKAFGLMTEAKRRFVDLSLTSDGAQLTNTISHVAAGLKFNVIGLCDPAAKQPLLLHAADSFVQSCNLCFPLRVVIAKDNKKTLSGSRSLYEMFNSREVSDALNCHPFKISSPGDIKLQWGALDDGYGAKIKEYFCFICSCRSSSIHVPQDYTKCRHCISKHQEDEQQRQQNDDHGNNNNNDHQRQQRTNTNVPPPPPCYAIVTIPFSHPDVKERLQDELQVLTSLVSGGALRGQVLTREEEEDRDEDTTRPRFE